MLKKSLIALLCISFSCAFSILSFADGWEKDSKGWRYSYTEDNQKKYLEDTFELIEGNIYSFGTDQYMITGWERVDPSGSWYYFDPSGAARKDPLEENGITYHFSKSDFHCLNPEGNPISNYELALEDLIVEGENINLPDPEIFTAFHTDLDEIREVLTGTGNFLHRFDQLPTDIPAFLKINHMNFTDIIRHYRNTHALLQQILQTLESPTTDYNRLSSLIEQYKTAYSELSDTIDKYIAPVTYEDDPSFNMQDALESVE